MSIYRLWSILGWVGDWGLGTGDWGLGKQRRSRRSFPLCPSVPSSAAMPLPIPNRQSPVTSPQSL